MIRAILAATLLAFSVPAIAFAQENAPPASVDQATYGAESPATEPAPEPAPEPESVPEPQYRTQDVALATEEGAIILRVEVERAPVTAANFLKYVDEKRFDGVTFYRALQFPDYENLGLLQGGTKGDPKRVLPPVAHEPTTQTGLTHKDGAISMARAAPGSAQGDFFIILGDLSALDADPSKEGDNLGYAVFGRVIGGMDVVQKILTAPISATEGEGSMRGQMLEKPVRILSARRLGG